jgi:hypothetical protein
MAPVEVVVSVQRAPASVSSGGSRVGARTAEAGAGTQGDAVKVVSSLPGAARGPVGELIAWGSTPAESRIYLDGVELPALYHGGGIRSVVPSQELSSITLLPGAFGPAYGRALGGVVELTSRELDFDSTRWLIQTDLLDAGAWVSAPLSPEWSASASARVGYADRWLEQLTDEDVGSLISVPSYRDWQLRSSFQLSHGERLDAVALGSRDEAVREVPSRDPALRLREQQRLGFERYYLRYRSEGEYVWTELTPFVGFDDARRSGYTGAQGWELGVQTWRYGLRGIQSLRMSSALTLRLGLDALGSLSSAERSGTPTLPAREGDPRVFGQAPGREEAQDGYRTHVLDVAPYVEADWSWAGLQLRPGLRVDTYLLETSRLRPRIGRLPAVGKSQATVVLEPRLEIQYALDARSRLSLTAGWYHQPPAPEDTSSVFGNPDLGLARGLHLSLAERVELSARLSVEVVAYAKRLTDLPVRSPLPAPAVAESLVASGDGRSYGVQMMLRHAPSRSWSGWITWTISRSERGAAGGELRRFEYDQPHVLALVLTRYLGSWTLGTRFRYATGSPRTPVIGASYDLLADRYEPIFGPLQASRLPAFAQLDLRADYGIGLGRGVRLSMYLDALNVLGRRNAEDIAYGPDFRERAFLTGIPSLLLVGARLER